MLSLFLVGVRYRPLGFLGFRVRLRVSRFEGCRVSGFQGVGFRVLGFEAGPQPPSFRVLAERLT